MMRQLFLRSTLCFVISLTSTVPLFAQQSDVAERLHDLFERRHAWEMQRFPERAMRRGDYSNAHRITDHSLEAINDRHETTTRHLKQLLAIDRAQLEEQDRISYDLFAFKLREDIGDHRFREYLMPIGPQMGSHHAVAQMHKRVRFEKIIDYENYIKRLLQVPQWIDEVITRLKKGLEQNYTPPKITVQGVPEQFASLLKRDGINALRTPFEQMPGFMSEQTAEQLRTRFDDQALPAVRHALEKLHVFLVEQYLPTCRDTIAATALPNGEAYYRHQLKYMTTLDLSPRDIHETGLREVKRIRAEMMDVIRQSDFMDRLSSPDSLSDDELFRRFVEFLRTDDRFYYEQPEALIDGYKVICKTVDGQMPKFFKTLPRQPYGVKAIPDFMAPDQYTAYYSAGDLRNAEPGYFYANTYDLSQRPKYEMVPLAMHEAVPGHHHQIALAKELENIPKFRQDMYITAFGEGWALYAERLGLEMNMYQDPYDNFGRLLYEMWRACRLVVDPAMHALGWSRQDAVDFMMKNTALSELNIRNEVDRYIAWPGQACAYKLGEIRIRDLREKAEQTLGEEFNIRTFHDAVLLNGAVTLPILETQIEQWIARRRNVGEGASTN